MTELITVFQTNPWFKQLPQTEQVALLEKGTIVSLSSGATIVRKNDTVDLNNKRSSCFYGIISGKLKATSMNLEGKEAIFARIEAGNWFGELSLIDGLPRTHDLVADSDTQLWAISVERFFQLMERPTFSLGISKLLASRLRVLYEVISLNLMNSIRSRVAQRLVILAHGDATLSDSPQEHISITHEDLAMMLGISRQTLNKELQAFVQQGAIKLEYRGIQVLDIQLLSEAISGVK